MSERIDNQLLDTLTEAQKIEQDWLASIKAPVKRLPKHVAEAVATRIVLSSMPVEMSRLLIGLIEFNRIIKPIKEGTK